MSIGTGQNDMIAGVKLGQPALGQLNFFMPVDSRDLAQRQITSSDIC